MIKRIKRYELIEEVGRGGMAVVYRASDTALDRLVAVKVLHPHLASRPESARRFFREARAVAKLRHSNIVEIFDTSSEADTDVDQQFIVTEFIDGGTLRELVEEHTVQLPCVGVAIAVELCKALEHAHEHGIVHRDIKPENVMISGEGVVKLMDFGIAQVLDADRMTASGSLLGSPAHMPPEIVDGKIADKRADIFSLGTVLYYVITNALPFEGNNPTAVLRNIIEGRYQDPTRRNPRVGRKLGGIVRRCMEVDRDDRYDDIETVHTRLQAELDDLGIEDARALVTAYIADPDGFTESYRPKLVDRLVQRAEESLAARDIPAATDYINRILAYEPDDPRADALLRKIGSRRRVMALAIAALVCVFLLGAGYYFSQLASTSTEEGATASPSADAEAEESATQETQSPPVVARVTVPDSLEANIRGALQTRFSEAALAGKRHAQVEHNARGKLIFALVAGARQGAPWLQKPDSRLLASAARVRPKDRTPAEPDASVLTGKVGPDLVVTDVLPTGFNLEPKPPTTIPVRIKTYQESGYLLYKGKKFRVNGNKIATLQLPLGTHDVSVGCEECRPKTLKIVVTRSDLERGELAYNSGKQLWLEWKQATVVVGNNTDLDTYESAFYFLGDPAIGPDDIAVPIQVTSKVRAEFTRTMRDREVHVFFMTDEDEAPNMRYSEMTKARLKERFVQVKPGQYTVLRPK